MVNLKISLVLVLYLSLSSIADESVTENNEIKVDDRKNEETQAIQATEKSLLTKLSNWIFPFGSSDDAVTAETRRVGAEYLPPASPHKSNCNPCNKEPWIPVAANYGRNTLIGFVQPSEYHKHMHLSNGGGQLQSLQPPQPQFRDYGPPPVRGPSNDYGPPLQVAYGPPQPAYNAPSPAYNAPNHRRPKLPPIKFVPKENHFGAPTNQYLPPSQHRSPSQHRYLTEFHPPPPPNNNGLSHRLNSKYKPYVPFANYNGPPSVHRKPPPDAHSPAKHPTQINVQQQHLPMLPPANNFVRPTQPSKQYLPAAIPSDSYGKPIHGPDAALANVIKSEPLRNEYVPPIEPLSQSSTIEHYRNEQLNSFANRPIPFPNLSNYPVLPLHNAQEFRGANEFHQTSVQNANYRHRPSDNYIQSSSGFDNVALQNPYAQNPINLNHQTNVEIIKSVPIAGYLATIEHPIDVIQSPLVEVDASSFNENAYLDNNDNKKQQVNLNENPIVVEDAHASATSNNATVIVGVNQKRNNDKDLNVYVNIKESISSTISPNIKETSLFNPQLVNSFIHDNSVKELAKKNNSAIKQLANDDDWMENSRELLTSMSPPPKGESPWLSSLKGTGKIISTTGKTPKQIQIIIPYISNHRPTPFKPGQTTKVPTFSPGVNQYNNHVQTSANQVPKFTRTPFTTNAFRLGNNQKELPLYTIPPTSESVWLQHTDHVESDSNIVTQTAQQQQSSTTTVTNIRNLIAANSQGTRRPSFDVIKLQKHIDNWTEQEYSKNVPYINYDKVSTVGKFVPSKIIPDEYLTTPSYNETTTIKSTTQYDRFASGSSNGDSGTTFEDLQSNLILSDTTTQEGTTLNNDDDDGSLTTTTQARVLYGTVHNVNDTKPTWEKLKIENNSNEKIYVVTPQPIKYGFSGKGYDHHKKKNITFSSDKFAVSLDKLHFGSNNNTDLKIVLSEWPHLINDLETTTTLTTTKISSARPKFRSHPLFGLMDLSSYTPPPNATVETYSGHSKVITIVTPGSTTTATIKKKSDVSDEKKTSTIKSAIASNS